MLYILLLILILPLTSQITSPLSHWIDADMIETGRSCFYQGSNIISSRPSSKKAFATLNFETSIPLGYLDLFGMNNCVIQQNSVYYKLHIIIIKRQSSKIVIKLRFDERTTIVQYKFAYMIINHPDIILQSQKLFPGILEANETQLNDTKQISSTSIQNPTIAISLITFIQVNIIPQQFSFAINTTIKGNSIQVMLTKKQNSIVKVIVQVYIIKTKTLSNNQIHANDGIVTKGHSSITNTQHTFYFSKDYMINSFIFSITGVHMNKSKNWQLIGELQQNQKKVIFNYQDSLNVQFSINFLRFRKCSENYPKYISPSPSTDGCICHVKYFIKDDNKCQLCDNNIPTMRGCDTCEISEVCKTCFTPNNTKLNPGEQCKCDIDKQYYPFDIRCVHCSDLIYNCTKCSNNQTCIECQDKYYLIGDKCQECDDLCLTCFGQSDYCLTCNETANHIHQDNTCICPDKFYMDGVICKDCNTQCKLCNNTSYQCQQCVDGYYLSHSTCHICKQICLTCTNHDYCLTCDLNIQRTQKDNTCICIDKFYDDGVLCQSCNQQCLTCIDSPSQCYSCINGYYLSGVNCLRCSKNCQTCKNTAYFCLTCLSSNQLLQNNICICQIGQFVDQYFCQKCHDQCLECFQSLLNCTKCNSTAKRTFNNNKCDCLQPYSDCGSSGLIDCNPKICSLLTPITLNIIKDIQKDPNNNRFTYQISINPLIPQFLFDNFTKAFSIQGLPLGTHIQTTNKNGTISFNITYFQNVQDLQINITIDVRKLGYQFTKLTPISLITHPIFSSNNLALNSYNNNLYSNKSIFDKVVLFTIGFGLFGFLIGLGSSRIVSTEMMGVNQIAFFGLFILNNNDPLVQSLYQYGLFNGIFEIIPTNRQKSPYRIFATGQSSSIIANINVILVILALPLIVCLICYLIHLKSTKYRIRMRNYCRLLLGQWLLTAFIFILYNYSSSLTSFVLFSTERNFSFYINIAILIILSIIFGVLIWMYIKCKKLWMGQYKQYFNWNRYSQLCYLIPIFQRFVVGILITSINMSFVSSIISILLLMVCIVSVAIKKPFVQKHQNIRSIVCNCYSILILILYSILSINGTSKGQSFLIYIPYAINALVLINTATGCGFIIFWYIKNYRNYKNQKSCQNQQQYEQSLKYQLNKAYRQIQKNARNINAHQLVQNGQKRTNVNNISNIQ